jgi:hypothetical protein
VAAMEPLEYRISNKEFRISKCGVNDHPLSGWLGFPAKGRKNTSASVLQSLRL